MIGLLLALQCLGLSFQTPQALCRYVTHTQKALDKAYDAGLVCRGRFASISMRRHDKAMLMGRIKELEDANRKLRAEKNKK